MRFGTLTTVALVAGMALSSEARDWGFNKDTVYEWRQGGDTVYLVNTGIDTLVLDSVLANDVDTSQWVYVGFGYQPFDGLHQAFGLSQAPEGMQVMVFPEGEKLLPPGESAIFHHFDIGPFPITGKISRTLRSLPGDTIMMSVRLKAGELEDTLIVVGIFDYGTSLSPRPPVLLKGAPMLLDRDLQGRRVEPSGNIPALRR